MKKYINSTGNGFLGKHYYGSSVTNYGRRKIKLSNKELDEVLLRIDEGYTVRFDNQLTLQQYQSIIKQLKERKKTFNIIDASVINEKVKEQYIQHKEKTK